MISCPLKEKRQEVLGLLIHCIVSKYIPKLSSELVAQPLTAASVGSDFISKELSSHSAHEPLKTHPLCVPSTPFSWGKNTTEAFRSVQEYTPYIIVWAIRGLCLEGLLLQSWLDCPSVLDCKEPSGLTTFQLL